MTFLSICYKGSRVLGYSHIYTVLLRNNLTLRSRSKCVPNAVGTRSERGRNAVGTRPERGRNAAGTRPRRNFEVRSHFD